MTRYVIRFALKDAFYDHTPEHVVITFMECSVLSETEDAAVGQAKAMVRGADERYRMLEVVPAQELKSSNS